jgi:GrpB-like predicted nucleotidyltransferase (UPF0157 family)
MVTIVPYDQRWTSEFGRIALALRNALGVRAISIDHIGSTSVPNLSAKDVIDVQITVRELAPAVADALRAAGLVEHPEVTTDHLPPGLGDAPADWAKWLFVEPPGQRRMNVHVRVAGKPNQRYAILVRDFLRANPLVAAAYAELKSRLAAALADPADYPEVKDPAVDLIYFAAEAWAVASGWRQP